MNWTVIMFAHDGYGVYVQHVHAANTDKALEMGLKQAGLSKTAEHVCTVILPGEKEMMKDFEPFEGQLSAVYRYER